MAKIGLNSLYYSKLTEGVDGTPTYDGGKSFGKAVNCDVNITNNSAELYADDSLQESDTTFQNGTVSLGIDDDRETTFADVLGHTIGDDGEVTCNVNDVAPFVGLGRVVVKLVNNVRLYKAEILYKVKFAEPSQSDQTRGESVTFSTPTIEGKVATLKNGDWRDSKTFSTKAEAQAYILGKFASAGSTFRVNYDANGGTGTISTQAVDVGDSVTLDTGSGLTAPSNKEFGGWALTSGATVKDYDGGATYYPTRDVTFYAVWVDAT